VIVSPDFSEVRPTIARDKIKEMLTVTQDGLTRTVKINSSSLSIILSCPRKAYYTLHRNLRSRSESAALIFGSAIHKALEVFYAHPRTARSIPPRFKEISDLLAFNPDAAEDQTHFLYDAIRAFVAAAQPLAALPDGDKRSIPNGIWILQEYFKSYINDPYVVYCDENGPVTERTFELVLHEEPGLRIILFGTVDVVLRHEINGNVLPADHKTTSRLGADFFNRLKPNHQYTGYLLGAQRVLGLQTNEFMVNGIEVKEKPKTPRGKGVSFSRQPTVRNETDIKEFIDAVIWATKSYLQWADTNNWPIGNVDSCTMWGGCNYLEVCSAPPKLRENLLESKYYEPKDEE